MKDPNLNKPIWFPLQISLNAEWMEQPWRKAEGWMFKGLDVQKWEADLTGAQVCGAGVWIGVWQVCGGVAEREGDRNLPLCDWADRQEGYFRSAENF